MTPEMLVHKRASEHVCSLFRYFYQILIHDPVTFYVLFILPMMCLYTTSIKPS